MLNITIAVTLQDKQFYDEFVGAFNNPNSVHHNLPEVVFASNFLGTKDVNYLAIELGYDENQL